MSLIRLPKLLFLVTEDWYFCSHRLPIAIEAKRRGFDVVVATNVNGYGDFIESQGITLIALNIDRGNLNPWKELAAIRQLIKVYKNEKPDIVHHVAMKPVLYGSFAAWVTNVPRVVNALAGMGYLFISQHLKTRVFRLGLIYVLSIIFRRNGSRLILQNEDDAGMLIRMNAVRPRDVVLIRGSGVDTEVFYPNAESCDIPVVMLVSRMLSDKGIMEFVEAARLLKAQNISARFVMVGDIDLHNPAAIDESLLAAWHNEGVIEWWGKRDDIPSVLQQAHVVCLPSYREGLPKVLLEAAACGRPIVTTDVPGCREVVKHGENGLLVPVRAITELANALKLLIERPALRQKMGARGRKIAVAEFAVEKVVAETIALYEELLAQ